ncbi:hypothetical protein QBC38DRAFT_152433 [Podospora fimiseda]|uniref:Uncharacterized protein n=1 Tax=Podospora fimiseda TaxID=252190 RepID=A0AAN6YNF6_9PEZI|nr:hypothetical protein QBC38DRAFT_152433 [Podospora fimiseda]
MRIYLHTMSARVQGTKSDDKSLIQETYYRPALDRARGATLKKTSNIQLQPLRTTLKMLCARTLLSENRYI